MLKQKKIQQIGLWILALLIILLSLLNGGRGFLANNLLLFFSGFLLLLAIKNNKFYLRKAHYILFGFLFFSALSLFFSLSAYNSFVYFLQIFSMAILFFVISALRISTKDLRILINIILATAFILCLIGFYFYITGHYSRLTSIFYWPNPFAGYLLFVIPLSLIIFFKSKKKVFIVPLLTVFSTAFILTGSRGAFLALIIPLIFVFYYQRNFFKKNFYWLICLVLLIFVFSSLLSNMNTSLNSSSVKFFSKPNNNSFLDTSSEIRLSYWEGSWNIFKDFPWFGVGFDNFQNIYPFYQTSPLNAGKYAHNVYLKTLSEAGIFTFLFFIFFLIYIFLIARKKINFNKKPIILGFWVGALGSCLHCFLDIDWYWLINLFLFSLFSACFYQATLNADNLEHGTSGFSKIAKSILFFIAFFLVFKASHGLFVDYSFTRACNYRDMDSFNQAQKYYNQSLFLNPNPNYQRAFSYFLLVNNKIQQAEDLSQKLKKTDKHNALNYQLSGYIAINKNNLIKAEQEFRQAITLDPLNRPIYYLDLARLYLGQNRKQEAKNIANKILKHYPPEVIQNRKGLILSSQQTITSGIEKDILELQKIINL